MHPFRWYPASLAGRSWKGPCPLAGRYDGSLTGCCELRQQTTSYAKGVVAVLAHPLSQLIFFPVTYLLKRRMTSCDSCGELLAASHGACSGFRWLIFHGTSTIIVPSADPKGKTHSDGLGPLPHVWLTV